MLLKSALPAAGSGSEAPLTAAGATNPFGDPWPSQSQSVPLVRRYEHLANMLRDLGIVSALPKRRSSDSADG